MPTASSFSDEKLLKESKAYFNDGDLDIKAVSGNTLGKERIDKMNDRERMLLRFVCEGDIRSAQKQAQIMLEGIKSQKDQQFKDSLLSKLKARPMELMELPANMRELLVAEDVSEMDCSRLLIRGSDEAIIRRLMATRTAAQRLAQMKIFAILPPLSSTERAGAEKRRWRGIWRMLPVCPSST